MGKLTIAKINEMARKEHKQIISRKKDGIPTFNEAEN